MPYQSPFRCPKVLFGGKSPFLSLVGPLFVRLNKLSIGLLLLALLLIFDQ